MKNKITDLYSNSKKVALSNSNLEKIKVCHMLAAITVKLDLGAKSVDFIPTLQHN